MVLNQTAEKKSVEMSTSFQGKDCDRRIKVSVSSQ